VDPFLATAALLAVALGAAHSTLGERYILRRLFRRPLPPLFGGDSFTRRTLRFAWHLTTLAWWGMAALLAAYAMGPLDGGGRLAVRTVAGVFAASALLTAVVSRGRHLAWPVMLAIAALSWAGAG
jgi:hypothetical protein